MAIVCFAQGNEVRQVERSPAPSSAHFDSRMWMAPDAARVVDYFRWRQADATRCCLNGWCCWTLRKEGLSVRDATTALHKAGFSAKNELLFQRGINFNDVPAWQRRGTGVYWSRVEVGAKNPLTGHDVKAIRRRVHVDEELPRGKAFELLVEGMLR